MRSKTKFFLFFFFFFDKMKLRSKNKLWEILLVSRNVLPYFQVIHTVLQQCYSNDYDNNYYITLIIFFLAHHWLTTVTIACRSIIYKLKTWSEMKVITFEELSVNMIFLYYYYVHSFQYKFLGLYFNGEHPHPVD